MTSQQENFTLSANRLHDGVVVVITKDLSWSEKHKDALIISSHQEAQNLLTTTTFPHHIIDPYIIALHPTHHTPSLFREQIRTLGPTVRKDLGRQADS